MPRSRISFALAMFAALALAMPLAARSNDEKNSKPSASATMELAKSAVVGGKQIQAGTYDVKAKGSKLTLSHDGKVVAEAPIQWKDEQSKSMHSTVVVDSGSLTEVHFPGKTQYAQVSTESATATGQQ
jgi:hypothetical protein